MGVPAEGEGAEDLDVGVVVLAEGKELGVDVGAEASAAGARDPESPGLAGKRVCPADAQVLRVHDKGKGKGLDVVAKGGQDVGLSAQGTEGSRRGESLERADDPVRVLGPGLGHPVVRDVEPIVDARVADPEPGCKEIRRGFRQNGVDERVFCVHNGPEGRHDG